MKRLPEPDQATEALAPEPDIQAIEALPEPEPILPPEPEPKEYTVKPGCAIEHLGIRYEGNAEEPVKVKLSASDAEIHKANLE